MTDKQKWTPATMGKKGGKRSKRKLTTEQAMEMVEIRRKKKKLEENKGKPK